jgi:hypothetical protein
MNTDKKEGFEAYPKPSEADKQFDNQNEFIDQQPNDFSDKSITDLPENNADRQSNDPKRDAKEDE